MTHLRTGSAERRCSCLPVWSIACLPVRHRTTPPTSSRPSAIIIPTASSAPCSPSALWSVPKLHAFPTTCLCRTSTRCQHQACRRSDGAVNRRSARWWRGRERVVTNLIGRQWNRGLGPLNQVRKSLGIKSKPRLLVDQVRRARKMLVLTSRSFDFAAELPDNVRYVGPVLDDPTWATGQPWGLPAGEHPVVLVAMSSTFQDQTEVLQRVIDGLANSTYSRNRDHRTGARSDDVSRKGQHRHRSGRSAFRGPQARQCCCDTRWPRRRCPCTGRRGAAGRHPPGPRPRR